MAEGEEQEGEGESEPGDDISLPGGIQDQANSSFSRINMSFSELSSGACTPTAAASATIPWATLARSASPGGFVMMKRSRSFAEPLHASSVDLLQLSLGEVVQAVPPAGLMSRIAWKRDLLAIGVVYFVEGILDMLSLAVSYYLKDTLGLGPSAAGLVQTLGQLPWQATPLLALVTDGVPVFGYHRKGYLMLVGLVGALCWLLLTLQPTLVASVVVIVVANACTAWTQVIADAVTVKLSQGQDQQLAAFYQSYSWATYMIGGVLSAYTTGRLLDAKGTRPVFLLAAGCLVLDAGCALLISEDSQKLVDDDGGAGSPQRAGRMGSGRGSKGFVPRARAMLVQVWDTIKLPHILVPALFIFLWQSAPSPTSAMFYFQTNVLGFSAGFLELVYLFGVLAALAGVLLYNTFLVNRPMRTMLLWSALCATALNATQLLLVSRLNLRLGLSDKLFVLGDYAMLAAVAEVMMTPMLAIAARVCPEGIEATLYASLYCIINLSTALSTALGALVTRMLGVTDTNFTNMTWLVLVCNICMLLPLPLLLWVPDNLDPGKPAHDEADPEAQTLLQRDSSFSRRDSYGSSLGRRSQGGAGGGGSSSLLDAQLSMSVSQAVAVAPSLPAVYEHVEGLPHVENMSPSATVWLGRVGLPAQLVGGTADGTGGGTPGGTGEGEGPCRERGDRVASWVHGGDVSRSDGERAAARSGENDGGWGTLDGEGGGGGLVSLLSAALAASPRDGSW